MSQLKDSAKISDAEWEVMRVVWTQTEVYSRDICQILVAKMAWKPATVKTLLSRLVEKGFLQTKAQGNRFIYSAAISEEAGLKLVSEDLLGHICSKKVGETIADLLTEATLSFSDIELLEKALAQKKLEAVAEVPCNCAPGQCNCHHQGAAVELEMEESHGY